MLKAGAASTQTVLAFTGLDNPHGMAIANGNVVDVTDSGNNRVVKLTTDRNTKVTTQAILPFAGLNNPQGVAVDGEGNLYVVDTGNNRVLKLTKAIVAQLLLRLLVVVRTIKTPNARRFSERNHPGAYRRGRARRQPCWQRCRPSPPGGAAIENPLSPMGDRMPSRTSALSSTERPSGSRQRSR